MTRAIVVADSAAAFAREGARLIAGEIARALARGGEAHVALAGGRTPRAVYQRLAAGDGQPIDWGRVALYFGDERCVPPDDPESNYRMVRESLLDRLPVAPGRVERMEAERGAAAAEDYERRLPARFDLIVLGLGEDGHTAALFPHSPALAERERRVVFVRAPKPPPERLTVTPPVIRAAAITLLLAAGPAKRDALARLFSGDDPAELPARLARNGLFVLDREAAAGLPPDLPSIPSRIHEEHR